MIVVLINQTKQDRSYLLLDLALASGELKTTIIRPNGKPLRRYFDESLAIMFEDRWKLPAGQVASAVLKFGKFGHHELPEPGEFELRATLSTPEGLVIAPPLKLTVIEPAPVAILESQTVPLEGYQARWPKDKQERAAMQQIKIGNRTWLFYRKFLSTELGGKVSATFRLTELQDKVEMKVEGAFGDHNPLTITYKDAKSPTGTTKLVINSINGMPWTEEEERMRQERLNPKKDAIPPPRAVKP